MKRWYIVQVYTGYEDFVQGDLSKRIIEAGLQDRFGEVLVPKGDVVNYLSGGDVSKEKIFPGYLLINMEMDGETFRLVRTMPRVNRFLGGESPAPLADKEVERIFSQMEGGLTVSSDKVVLVEGSEVQIEDGPFAGFVGIIEKVDDERESVTVMVSIFGRQTPVELRFDQVKN